MSAARLVVDLDDNEGLADADRDGLLRAAAMAGAQVRATAAAVDEGALSPLAGTDRPRTVVWVGGRGAAEAAGFGSVAGRVLNATSGSTESHHTSQQRQKSRRTMASPRSTASQSLRGRISAVTVSSRTPALPSG